MLKKLYTNVVEPAYKHIGKPLARLLLIAVGGVLVIALPFLKKGGYFVAGLFIMYGLPALLYQGAEMGLQAVPQLGVVFNSVKVIAAIWLLFAVAESGNVTNYTGDARSRGEKYVQRYIGYDLIYGPDD